MKIRVPIGSMRTKYIETVDRHLIIEWSNGSKSWWMDGKRHRENGPACEYSNGSKEWWINGVEYTEDEFREYQLIKELSGIK